MFLSDEQRGVALFGMRWPDEPGWSLVDLPVGPQPIPAWAKAMAVYWADGYGNAPTLKLKSYGDLRHWPDKRFTRTGDLWLAEAPDGRAEAYYQAGELRPAEVQMFRAQDGTLRQHRRMGRYVGNTYVCDPEPGEFVQVERLCTPQQDGFGGAHIHITMTDGTPAVLRGPWHGPCPSGFVEASYYDVSDPSRGYGLHHRKRRPTPWHDRVTIGGLLLRAELLERLFARFLPHLRLARVNLSHGDRLQPLKPEWDEPKAWILARQRLARKQAEWDAMEPAKRPPYVLCNWPAVCGGKPHCAVAECNHCTKRAAA